MTPIETLQKAADELRVAALAVSHKRQPCPGWDCDRCGWQRLADDCDRAANELERAS